MQCQLREIFCFHRAKRTQPHMQRDTRQLDALALQTSQQFIAEMKPRRGCRNSTGSIRITGLVTLGISRIMTIDVRRQWNFSALIEQRFDRLRIAAIGRKLHNPSPTGGVFRQHLERDCGAINRELIPRTHALCRPSQTQPSAITTGL